MQQNHFNSLRIWLGRTVLFLALLLPGCASLHPVSSEAELETLYNRAILDAEIAEPNEISSNLIAIVPENKDLVWRKDREGNANVLVTTWTKYPGYDDKIGQPMDLQIDIWVTAVPEMKNRCRSISGDQTLRIKQLLGLPLRAGYTKFVEMWVKPTDLFRPTADPEITDHQAEIDFRPANPFTTLSDDYRKWFAAQKKTSYQTNGYPWTRLGYTYDWGNPDHPEGLSEFIIIKGARVEIKAVTSTADYCR